MEARSDAALRRADHPGHDRCVQRDPNGLSAGRAEARASARADQDRRPRLPRLAEPSPAPSRSINTLGLVPSSREHSTTAITYLYFPARYGFETRDELAHTFAGHIPEEEGLVGVTGAGPARITQYDSIQDALPLVGAATAALIALLVGVDFLSPLPALLVLCAGGLSSPRRHPFARLRSARTAGSRSPARSSRCLWCYCSGSRPTTRSSTSQASAAGYREREPLPAARAVATQFTPTILVAGLTVACGTAALLVGRLDFMRAFGSRPRVVGADRRRRLCHVRSRRDRAARACALLAEPGAAPQARRAGSASLAPRASRLLVDCAAARAADRPPLRGRPGRRGQRPGPAEARLRPHRRPPSGIGDSPCRGRGRKGICAWNPRTDRRSCWSGTGSEA